MFAYAGLLAATVTLLYVQGFKQCGINLDGTLLKWLGGATVGAIAGLLTLTLGAVFQTRKTR